jgi:TetR/AcrR family transcriptional regulator, transcriptional repressor for nem operon
MARPREFDEQAVLDAASDIFWTKGYEATSTRDLTARAGLTTSSMYAAFGDKRRLFRRALDHYLGRLREKMSRLDATALPGKAITGFFEDTIKGTLRDALQRGCMLVNSALEASPENAELRDAIAHELRLIESFFRECLIAGQARGEISSVHLADDAARQLLAVLLGIRVLARVRPERALLAGAVRPTLESLGLPPLTIAADTAKSSRRRS